MGAGRRRARTGRPPGWPATIGVGYAFLLVPPVLPWRRRWSSRAVPASVLVICGVLALAAGFDPIGLFILCFPVILALGILVLTLVVTLLGRRAAPDRAQSTLDRAA